MMRRLATVLICLFAGLVWSSPSTAAAQPVRYLLIDPPPQPYPPIRVVHVHPYTPPNPPVIVQPPRIPVVPPPSRDPYGTDGLVVLGGGVGGVGIFYAGEQVFAAAYRLQFGVALRQAQFNFNFDFVPSGITLDNDNRTSLYTAGASFDYRFLEDSPVHPIVGLGLETLFLNPEVGDTATGFAGTARFGFEFALPLTSGALAFGIDARGHRMFAITKPELERTMNLLSFGAYANYRF